MNSILLSLNLNTQSLVGLALAIIAMVINFSSAKIAMKLFKSDVGKKTLYVKLFACVLVICGLLLAVL